MCKQTILTTKKVDRDLGSNKFTHIIKSPFVKSVVLITGGTVFAQVINIFISPIITRLYSPNEYGMMTLYTAIMGMTSLLGALCYDSAIPIADDDDRAINILILSLLVLLGTTTVLTIMFYTCGDSLLKLFDATILTSYIYLIPTGFFMTGIYTILAKWAFRKRRYNIIAQTKYSQSIVSNIAKILLGVYTSGPLGLILGSVIGQSAGITNLGSKMITHDMSLLKKISISEVKRSGIRYMRFPIYSAPSLLLTSFSDQIPIIATTHLYGSAMVGNFGLAKSITFLPMVIIGQSVQDVFYGEAANIGQKNPKQVKDLSKKMVKYLAIIGAIPMITLALFGPDLFSFVFGKEWFEAGVYTRYLTIYVYLHLLVQPQSAVFSIYEKQRELFIINILKVIVTCVIFAYASICNIGAPNAVALFSCCMSVIELIKYRAARMIVNGKINGV